MDSKKEIFIAQCPEGKAPLTPYTKMCFSLYIFFLFSFSFFIIFFPFDLCRIIITADPLQLREIFAIAYLQFWLRRALVEQLSSCRSRKTTFSRAWGICLLRGMTQSASVKNSVAHSFRRLGSQKLPCVFNFPVSRARPEKIV